MTHFARMAGVAIRKMSSSQQSYVLFEKIGKAGMITLNRPKSLNAFTRGMSEVILDKLLEYGRDDSIEVVCIKSAGGKAFCAGGDVFSLTGSTIFDLGLGVEEQMQDLIANYPKPYVALTNGITFGGGMGVAVNGTFTVATENSLFCMPETAIGLYPDAGASYFLSRVPQSIGMFLALTGTRINGGDAKHLGLVSHYISSVGLENFMSNYINVLDKNTIKSYLDSFEEPQKPVFTLEEHSSTIRECFSAPTVPEIIERLRRDPSQFASKALSRLSKMSPISLCIAHRMQTLAAELTVTECIRMEYNAGLHVFTTNELKEGVRALLIDKDNSPKWNPPTLDQVTD